MARTFCILTVVSFQNHEEAYEFQLYENAEAAANALQKSSSVLRTIIEEWSREQ